MVKILLAVGVIVSLLPSELQARDRIFFEIGPRYAVSLSGNPLDRYWGGGWGAGGSVGYNLKDRLALVGGVSYRVFPFSGEGPYMGSRGNWGGDFIPVEGIPGPFGERSSILETGLSARIYRGQPGYPRGKTFFSFGFGYQRESVGDIVVFVEQQDWPNNTFYLAPYEWQGKNYSGWTPFVSTGVGWDLYHYRGHPLLLEFGGQFGLGSEGSSVYLPVRMNVGL